MIFSLAAQAVYFLRKTSLEQVFGPCGPQAQHLQAAYWRIGKLLNEGLIKALGVGRDG